MFVLAFGLNLNYTLNDYGMNSVNVMMKTQLYLFFLNLILLFTGCVHQESLNINDFKELKVKEDSEMLNFLFDDIKIGINIDSVITDYKCVALETNDSSLISYIDDIKFDDDLIFIGDYYKNKSVYIFSKDGKYLNKISSLGQSGNEYVSLTGFDIDKDKNIIYLLDGERGKILSWNYDAAFMGVIDLPFNRINAFLYKGKCLFYFDFGFRQNDFFRQSPFNMIAYNVLTKSVMSEFFPYDYRSFSLRIGERNPFYRINDDVYYRTLLGNSAYKIGIDTLDIVCKVDFGKNQYPEEFYLMNNKELRKKQEILSYRKLGMFLEFEN